MRIAPSLNTTPKQFVRFSIAVAAFPDLHAMLSDIFLLLRPKVKTRQASVEMLSLRDSSKKGMRVRCVLVLLMLLREILYKHRII